MDPWSGLALYYSLDAGTGVTDPDYQANGGVVLINMKSLFFSYFSRIA